VEEMKFEPSLKDFQEPSYINDGTVNFNKTGNSLPKRNIQVARYSKTIDLMDDGDIDYL